MVKTHDVLGRGGGVKGMHPIIMAPRLGIAAGHHQWPLSDSSAMQRAVRFQRDAERDAEIIIAANDNIGGEISGR